MDAVAETDEEPTAVVETVKVEDPHSVTDGLTDRVADDDAEGFGLADGALERDATADMDADGDTDRDFRPETDTRVDLDTADDTDAELTGVADEGADCDEIAELDADCVCTDDGEAFADDDGCAETDAGAVPAALLVPPAVREAALDCDDEGDAESKTDALPLGDAEGNPEDDAVGHGARVRDPVGIDGFAVLLEDSVDAVETETDAKFEAVSEAVSVMESTDESVGHGEDDGALDSEVEGVAEADNDAPAEMEEELVPLAETLAELLGAELIESRDDGVPLSVGNALVDALALAAVEDDTLTEGLGGALDVGTPDSDTDILDEGLAADDVLACADFDALSVAL